jgi:hypothetical protein
MMYLPVFPNESIFALPEKDNERKKTLDAVHINSG